MTTTTAPAAEATNNVAAPAADKKDFFDRNPKMTSALKEAGSLFIIAAAMTAGLVAGARVASIGADKSPKAE